MSEFSKNRLIAGQGHFKKRDKPISRHKHKKAALPIISEALLEVLWRE
jgi:hypothetical protein